MPFAKSINLASSKEILLAIERAVKALNDDSTSQEVRGIFLEKGKRIVSLRSFVLGCIRNQIEWLEDDGHIPRG